MTDAQKKQLRGLGWIVAVAVPAILLAWVGVSAALDLDVVQTSRLAGLCAMTVLIGCILATLRLGPPGEPRVWGFLVFWFVISLAFDVAWEIPLMLIPGIAEAEITRANLPWAIFWWAYTLSDALYTEVTPLVRAAELWWFLGNLIGAVGLWMLHRGRELHALTLLGLCGALQAYNASLYMGITGFVDRFATIPPDWKAHALFWGLNGFWALAAGTASVLSFRMLLARVAAHERGAAPRPVGAPSADGASEALAELPPSRA